MAKDPTDVELVEALATDGMGWTGVEMHEYHVDDGTPRGVMFVGARRDVESGETGRYRPWSPLFDANDTMELIEAMRKRGWDFEHKSATYGHYFRFHKWIKSISNWLHNEAKVLTFQRAVCLAAYAAIMAEKEQGK